MHAQPKEKNRQNSLIKPKSGQYTIYVFVCMCVCVCVCVQLGSSLSL